MFRPLAWTWYGTLANCDAKWNQAAAIQQIEIICLASTVHYTLEFWRHCCIWFMPTTTVFIRLLQPEYLPTTLVIPVEQSIECVIVCIRTITFQLDDLWFRYLSLWFKGQGHRSRLRSQDENKSSAQQSAQQLLGWVKSRPELETINK